MLCGTKVIFFFIIFLTYAQKAFEWHLLNMIHVLQLLIVRHNVCKQPPEDSSVFDCCDVVESAWMKEIVWKMPNVFRVIHHHHHRC